MAVVMVVVVVVAAVAVGMVDAAEARVAFSSR